MKILENKHEFLIISIIIVITTVIFTLCKLNLTFQNQKGSILHILQHKTIELELQLTNMAMNAEDHIKYITHNISFTKDPSKLLREAPLNNEIEIAIINKNKEIITKTKNFDDVVLTKYLTKGLTNLNKIKLDDVNWYYGSDIGNRILATSNDNSKDYKIIFLLDVNKTLQNSASISKSSGEFIRNFNFAVLDNRQNLISVTNLDWFKTIDPIIFKKFFDKNYQLKSKLYQFSGENYFLRKMSKIPNVAIMVMADTYQILANSLQVLLVRVLEIIVGLIGVILLVLLIFRDFMLKSKLTKSYEIAKKANQVKSEFLNFVAHEIKSPLSCITMSADLMQKRTLGQEFKDYNYYIDSILENSNLIIEFVDDILDESLLLQNKFKLNKELCSLQEITLKSISINNIRYKHLDVKGISNIAQNFPSIFCDKKRMLQILNNLISNAMKFSPTKSEITINARIENEKYFSVSVIDKGFGMEQEEIASLINEVVNTNKYEQGLESYGIGFKIVKILTQAHSGSINIKSTVGLGTEIKITLPIILDA